MTSAVLLPSQRSPQPLRVVVLSCDSLGIDVSNALSGGPHVDVIAVITAPYRRRILSFRQKVARIYRMRGVRGLAVAVAAKVWAGLSLARRRAVVADNPRFAGIRHIEVDDFHNPEAIAQLKALDSDLGVIAGTYILKDSVFALPRFGSINLHSGKTPQYRGAAPAFWELYNGESTVGITIHRVESSVDSGDVLLQRTFPLDRAPVGDPMAYIERYRHAVLRPNGISMLVEVAQSIAAGTAKPEAQDHTSAKVYRTPDHRAIRELKRRVRQRRQKSS